MKAGIGSYDPNPAYLQALQGLARVGASNPDYLRDGVGRILDRAKDAHDLRQRNRMIFDAVQLAGGTWTVDHNPDVFDVDTLQRELEHATKGSAIYRSAIHKKLTEAVDSVVRETHRDFDDFYAKGEKPRLRPDGNDNPLAAFDRWYRQYRVYLGLDLPADETAAIKEAQRRIEFMLKELDRLEEGDLREFYYDDAWFYVREKYNAAHPEAATEADGAD